MARGRPPKNKENKEVKEEKGKFSCICCRNEYVETNFYNTNSNFFKGVIKLPYCKQCIEKFYQYYFNRYTNEGCLTPEKKAIKRLCMAFDIYYVETVYNSAMQKVNESEKDISPMSQYMRIIQLSQYNKKNETYENTITEAEEESRAMSVLANLSEEITVDEKTVAFFGMGFANEDYEYLKREYDDWTARHECNTKAQEEVFKRICFKQLEILKATRRGEDTKNLDDTFQKLLDTAKLQPKQNSGDTTADNQTFGTLIDKWENTRPLPEIDEELRDVDKIGIYIDTFFKGHTCKMLNVKNAFSNLYSSMMKKFTVNKPEYNLDEDNYDSELNFDTIFGDQSLDFGDE